MKYYPVGRKIRDPELRVIDQNGENLGVFKREEALELAEDRELDLVLVAHKANPPVAKILNFRKFLAEKRAEGRKARRGGQETKTLTMRPHIDKADLSHKIERAREFLEEGCKVRFSILFPGRSIIHPEIGKKKLIKIKQALSDTGRIEKEIRRKGRFMYLTLGPK